ncbi:hypothetical protein [Salisediminibacterium beveridgei]|uniref:Uncharacterized protein n=1 Tax=Salisediminibacterium beveridgei TaxID=632773 RepID=A0A1D7QTF3_9BACI|nr:hypothetical protein [Salisediminibacterium beveridgei]AOM82291.1 hypothetical protein BBEV_0921 [Salisediminibacterium beveridgei]
MRMIKTFTGLFARNVPLSVFAAGIVIFALFMLIVLPSEAERSSDYFGDTSAPDTLFLYSGDELYSIAREFGSEGRSYYIQSRFTFDIVWPLAYGFFLWSGIAYFSRNIRKQCAQYLSLLPVFGVILDFLENSSASLVMYVYPLRIPVLTEIVTLFTMTKWITIGASFVILILLIVYRIVLIPKKRQVD